MVTLWLVSLWRSDVSIVDIFWGLGFVVVAWLTCLAGSGEAARQWLLVGLTTVWGLRLASYLAWRNHGKPEDYRYRAMRDAYGPRFRWISLFLVFGLQGVILWIVSLPLQAGQLSDAGWRWLDAAGILFWTVGFAFETVGDVQLARFKADPANRGHVMDRGLWRYTRHPNYFGDFLVWWGLYLIAASGGAWWTVFSPVLMSVLLLRVSGVALLERSLKARTAGYETYVRRTSAFFPWPPKQELGDESGSSASAENRVDKGVECR
jgi:steroid 5-alpha reductase family enzyme